LEYGRRAFKNSVCIVGVSVCPVADGRQGPQLAGFAIATAGDLVATRGLGQGTPSYRGFQTKDGDLTTDRVEIEAVVTMYSRCECGHWIKLSRAPPPLDAATPRAPATLEQAISIGFRIVGD
jgi:hypothetical protein